MASTRVVQGTATRPRQSAIEATCDHFRVDRQGNLVSRNTLDHHDHLVGPFFGWVSPRPDAAMSTLVALIAEAEARLLDAVVDVRPWRTIDTIGSRRDSAMLVLAWGGEREKEDITMNASPAAPNVVLVHGGFVDGSGWRGVYDLLEQDGYRVSVVQNSTLSLDDDVAATRLIIDEQAGPVVLVGHSYGGAVITQAGNHEKVIALVYIAAFAPDRDESVNTLIANPPPGAPVPPILPPRDGFLFLDREKFHASFAGDLPADLAAFMADSQVPWGVNALAGVVTEPAWRTRPSWYLVTTEDRMIPPAAQRFMSQRAGSTVVEAVGSHSVYVSQPGATTALIKQAAAAVAAPR
jgi:pimeloyl-ACP methyl ester carboxylesterase